MGNNTNIPSKPIAWQEVIAFHPSFSNHLDIAPDYIAALNKIQNEPSVQKQFAKLAEINNGPRIGATTATGKTPKLGKLELVASTTFEAPVGYSIDHVIGINPATIGTLEAVKQHPTTGKKSIEKNSVAESLVLVIQTAIDTQSALQKGLPLPTKACALEKSSQAQAAYIDDLNKNALAEGKPLQPVRRRPIDADYHADMNATPRVSAQFLLAKLAHKFNIEVALSEATVKEITRDVLTDAGCAPMTDRQLIERARNILINHGAPENIAPDSAFHSIIPALRKEQILNAR